MGYVQIALEESPRYENAPTIAPYRVSTAVRYPAIEEFTAAPNPDMLVRDGEMRNIEGVPPDLPDAFAPDFGWTQKMYPNDLVWLLTLAGWAGTYTAGNGVITDPDGATIPANAHRWVFLKRGGRTAKTAQLIQGITENDIYIKHQAAAINEMSLNAAGEVSVSGRSLVWDPIANPSLVPAIDAASIVPMRRADIQIMTWLAGTGENDDYTCAITNPTELRKSLMTARSYFPDKHFHGSERVGVRGTLPKYSVDPEDLDAVLSGATFAGKIRWQSDRNIGATSYKYAVWEEFAAAQYTGGGPGPQGGGSRNTGASFDWKAGWDETAGYDAKITVVCAITSAQLETLP